ncbi:hypothetical protein XENOCAPTIV_028213 [Xenoophorus captivus]|uniref:Prion protein b n=1 Tax=Xenoophorus captivus TaxID=1517983 RepID=A0ABV0RFH3_9TELE
MGRLLEVGLLSLIVMSLLNPESTCAKKSSISGKKPSSSSRGSGTQTKPSSSQPGNYPRQPQSPNRDTNPYPAGGSYPYPGNKNTNPGGYPRQNPPSYPGAGGNQNHPRFGGGGYGYGGYGMGGSPFSRSVQGMGLKPQSTGFAKKAMVAAGVGAIAGMAVGYGLGRFPRPHFNFRNPEEEYYYNNYMYNRYGTKSTDEKDYGRDYVYKPPPRAETYENFMNHCMNGTDRLKDQGSSKSGANDEDDDTVSIEEIGYPALINQVKSRRCVEKYMEYSAKFMTERKAEPQFQPNRCSPMSYWPMQLFTSSLMLLSSMLLLQ